MAHRRDTVQMEQMWTNARLATMADHDIGLIDDGVVAARDGRIVYAGPADGAPTTAATVHDCQGRLMTPGLIDCHTHLIHGGNRANEWAMRLAGASYEDIARAGGGIVSTMRATRGASDAELVDAALLRLDALIAEGVTTIEIKSGYGLSTDDEVKMLRAARMLGERRAIRVEPTFLGAHALPPEFRHDSDAYIDLVVNEMIPAAAPLATAVDAFCEGIGFSPDQCARVIAAAKAHGLAVKLHAEQLSALHGSALAARHGALSADHLEHATEEDVAAMAAAGTVAVLLPGAYYFMRETRTPPVEAMRRHGTRIALATDCNPGTSPTTSLLLMLNMGATLFGLTVVEALRGVTVNAAAALGLGADVGTLEAGKTCDLAIWNVSDPAELVYRIGFNPLYQRIKDGR